MFYKRHSLDLAELEAKRQGFIARPRRWSDDDVAHVSVQMHLYMLLEKYHTLTDFIETLK